MFVLSDLDILTIATVVEIAITAQQGPVRQKDLRARYHLAARFPRAELTGACTRRHSQKHTRTSRRMRASTYLG
jgi:hypothetical protein